MVTGRKAIFMFRGGLSIITALVAGSNDTAATIAARMSGGGHIVCADDYWIGPREVAINLADVSCVILELKDGQNS